MSAGYIYPKGSVTPQSNTPLYFYPNTSREIFTDTSGIINDFYKGYQDLYNDLSHFYNVPDSDARMYWLKNAVEINSDNEMENPDDSLGLSNAFIRGVTGNGLLYEGSATTGDVNDLIQRNSDFIGEYVLGSIFGYTNGDINSTLPTTYPDKLPGIDDFIQKDIGSALAKGGQSYQGWGGSFYYWDVSVSGGQTIGSTITQTGKTYEEFLAINAKAFYDTARAGFSGALESVIGDILSVINAVGTALDGQVPADVRYDIIDRIVEAIDFGFGGDPNTIDGYDAVLDSHGNIAGWSSNGGPAQQNAALNARRGERLKDSDTAPWQGGAAVQQPQKNAKTLTAQAAAATSPMLGLTHDNTKMLAAVTSLENQNLVLDVLPSAGSPPVQTSGTNAPSALSGSVSIINGKLVYTPNQDFVGRDFVFFTTYDGSQYKTTLVPVMVTGQAHQTTVQNADASTTTRFFDQNGSVVAGRTDYANGNYDVLSYKTLGGQIYLAERDNYSKAGALITATSLQPDGYVATSTDHSSSGGGAPVTVSGQSSITINNPDTIVQATGAGDTINAGNLGETISISSGVVNVLDNAGAAINGNSNTITFYANSAGSVNGTGNTIDFSSAGSNIAASDATLNLGDSSTAVVTGNTNTATLYENAALWLSGSNNIVNISGTGDFVSIDNGTVNLWNAAGTILNGKGNTVISRRTNNTMTVTGSGNQVSLQATGDQLTMSSGGVGLWSDVSATISGSNDGIHLDSRDTLALNGSGNTVTSGGANDTMTVTGSGNQVSLQATGDQLTMSSGGVSLWGGISATVNGTSNSIYLDDRDTLILNGANDTVNAGGTNNSVVLEATGGTVSLSSGSIDLWGGITANVNGTNNSIYLDDRDTLILTGGNDTVTAGGANDSVVLESAGDTVSMNSGSIDLWGNITATVNGTGNAIYLDSRDTLTLNGSGNVVTAGGAGDTVSGSGSGNTLRMVNGETANLAGTGNTFVFSPTLGTETIGGYDASDNLQFSASTFASWSALLGHASQVGADTIIQTDPADTLTLKNVSLANLDKSHFHFV